MELEIAILDWSGTVSDDLEAVLWTVNQVRQRLGFFAFSKREYADSFGSWWRNIPVDSAVIDSMYEELFPQAPISPKPLHRAVEAIKGFRSKNIRVAVFSSHPTKFLEREAREYGVKNLIDPFEGSVAVKIDRINAFVQGLGIPRDRIAYFGDTVLDIRAGKEAGVVTVGVSCGYHGKPVYGTATKLLEAGPDVLVDDLWSGFDFFCGDPKDPGRN